jgi:hypothetical protein
MLRLRSGKRMTKRKKRERSGSASKVYKPSVRENLNLGSLTSEVVEDEIASRLSLAINTTSDAHNDITKSVSGLKRV